MRRIISLVLARTAAALALLTPLAPASHAAGLTDIGLLPGYAEASASGINNQGQVVGYAFNQGSTQRAFL
jgi:hypothetical protein